MAAFVFVLAVPAEAHAGFFSNLFGFLTSNSSQPQHQNQTMADVSSPLLDSRQSMPTAVGGPINDFTELASTQDSALVAPKNPLGTLPPSSGDQIIIYTVQPGDTPSSIAESFGISLNTLLWANDIRNASAMKVSDELIILPVSGVKYEVKKGDTIESIAKQFKGDPSDIIGFNGLAVGEPLEVGSTIIIPDGEFTQTPTPQNTPTKRFAGLPEFVGYYLRPIIGGRKTRGIHGYNGVDLAALRGSAVLASAEGTAIIAKSFGWNGGYGKYVVVAHPNGTQTLYAHLDQVLVTVGQHVAQGSLIGLLGSTGNSTGPHVHFEIRGAKNPF